MLPKHADALSLAVRAPVDLFFKAMLEQRSLAGFVRA